MSTQNLMREVASVLTSFDDVMGQIVEDAYRAGIKALSIDVDHDRRQVTIRSDGPGMVSPDVFSAAGRHGESVDLAASVSPGLMALVGLSKHMTLEGSSGKTGKTCRVHFDEGCFLGKPAVVEEVEGTDDFGVTVVASMKPGVELAQVIVPDRIEK